MNQARWSAPASRCGCQRPCKPWSVSRETLAHPSYNIGLFNGAKRAQKMLRMLLHASCAARDGHGVLLLGEPGAGKSDLILRLLHIGFALVADDQVDLQGRQAQPPPRLAGLLEIRGIGIVRMPYVAPVSLALAIQLGRPDRLPLPETHASGVPLITLDPAAASAPARVGIALDCALGLCEPLVGAFAA